MDEPTPENRQLAWEAWKHEHETGRRAHDEHTSYGIEHFKATIAFAVEAIRTSALINGGALVASLALMGATAQSAPQFAPHIIIAVRTFAIGVLCTGGAASVAYLAQLCFMNGHARVQRGWQHPYVKPQPPSRWWNWTGVLFQIMGIGAVVASYGAVYYGATAIYRVWHP